MQLCGSLVLTLAVLAGAHAVVIRSYKCPLPAAWQSSCTVHEVRIDPCPEAAENKPCKIQLGSHASISFDFTPNFSASKVQSQAFKTAALIDPPFDQMDIDGCKFTGCPVESGKRQTYTYSLVVNNTFAAMQHQVKWKLWNAENHVQQCCFKFAAVLVN